MLIQEMDELEHCVSLRGHINSCEEDTCKKRKKVKLKRWRKEVREKKCPALICRKKFWRVLIEESDTLGALPPAFLLAEPAVFPGGIWKTYGSV